MKQKQTKQHGRSMIEMLGVLAIIGVLSITALVGFTYAMNKHRANETIYDVMLRGTNVPMIDEYYANKPSGHEFRFPGLTDGTYYAMVTKKDSGSSYYVEATGVTYRVCEMILKMNPTDIDQIVVGNTVYQGDSDICGSTDGLAMKFCFGSDGTICNGTGHGGSSGGSGESSGSGGSSGGTSGSGTETDLCQDVICGGCQSCDSTDGECKDDNNHCPNGQTCSLGTCICTDNAQCEDGEICQNGSCEEPECTEDGDCTSPKTCVNYKCECPSVGTPGICQEIGQQNGCDVIVSSADGGTCTTSDGKKGTCQAGICEPSTTCSTGPSVCGMYVASCSGSTPCCVEWANEGFCCADGVTAYSDVTGCCAPGEVTVDDTYNGTNRCCPAGSTGFASADNRCCTADESYSGEPGPMHCCPKTHPNFNTSTNQCECTETSCDNGKLCVNGTCQDAVKTCSSSSECGPDEFCTPDIPSAGGYSCAEGDYVDEEMYPCEKQFRKICCPRGTENGVGALDGKCCPKDGVLCDWTMRDDRENGWTITTYGPCWCV